MGNRGGRVNTSHIESTLNKASATTTYTGGGLSGLGWVLSSEGVALIGVTVAFLGLGMQLYFGIRRDRRETREHKSRMDQMRAGQ